MDVDRARQGGITGGKAPRPQSGAVRCRPPLLPELRRVARAPGRWARFVDRLRRLGAELVRVCRAAFGPRSLRVVGYDRAHPAYTVPFDGFPPAGFVMYRRSPYRFLAPLDRLAWRRVVLLQHDASVPEPPTRAGTPLVVLTENRPLEAFYRDPRVKRVLVLSRRAGGAYLADGRAVLARVAPPAQPPRVRRKAPGEPLVLLAVGILGMVKSLDVVARIFWTLREELPVCLIISGVFGHNFEHYPEITPESYRRIDWDGLERRLHADPDVVFRRFTRREVMTRLYPMADVYLHLSRMDTYPFAALEAMSYSLPVVATRLNGLEDMVRDGENGFLIDHDGMDFNTPEWADRAYEQGLAATRALLTDQELRLRMGAASRARLQHAFDVEHLRRLLGRTYEEVLARGGGA